MSKNVLLISVDILKDRTAVHDNIDEKLIFPTIKVCQDMFIHPLLGSSLYNKIVTEVQAGSITGDYKNLLDDYIVDALCWYVLSEAVSDVSWQLWNKGVLRKAPDADLPDAETMEGLRNKYRTRAEWYGERLRTYLIANSATSFLPEYYTGNTDTDDINPQPNAFTMPIYLGEHYERVHPDKNNCHCNES